MNSLPIETTGARKFSKARELAKQLGLHPRTIRGWARAGKVHQYPINPRLTLYDQGEVFAFVESAGRLAIAG
jgi:hypothetical protein